MIDKPPSLSSSRFLPLPILKGSGQEAWRLGRLVHQHSLRPGAHRTPAAETGNDILSHAKGKYGELAFDQWLKQEGLNATHTPFRDDYTHKVEDDDFIVNRVRLEIKTKMRKADSLFPPPTNYNVNLGKKEIDDAIHVFVELSGKVALVNDPPALILGWAHPNDIATKGRMTWPGMQSDNEAFTFKRYDWDLAIRDLNPAATLLNEIR